MSAFDPAQRGLLSSKVNFKSAPVLPDRSYSAVLLVSPHFLLVPGADNPPGANFAVACTVTADLRDDPKYWRLHAKEILSVAECLEHEKSKMIMRRIADDYEYVAKLIERPGRGREKK